MKVLMKGNEAIAEAAVRAGCRAFFGYPITPQNEIPEYFSRRMPEVGGVFVQAESEVSAINMVYGAAGSGARVMTSSSSPGISLKQEGISYICAAELPCVIVNMVRGGPGLGGILPAQSDYFQAVKGGGHGDYRMLVYGPSTVQEAVDIMYEAFDKADKYRIPVMILGDGVLGQIMEAIELPEMVDIQTIPKKEWATDGTGVGESRRVINTLKIKPEVLEEVNNRLADKYKSLSKHEVRYEQYRTEDAEIIFVAYGTVARISKSAVDTLRDKGIKAGLFRPITLYPFPSDPLLSLSKLRSSKKFLAIELSMGQMVEDVRLAVNGNKPVDFFGKVGGIIITPDDIVNYVIKEK
ncbi:MAG: 3-methyl-2-oxobutanoate dehydrogenase subunit VorB [Clostridiales bacterium]|jgi:2-oxoglutarate ferredoxin oxidoreductase subunit alpha|nr:3-methyl-2-oxobutanoate dehydrogenase subunit VorB [Clostridiales bacterium]